MLTTRGFLGRRLSPEDAARLPPGQYKEAGFPVLSAGPTPRITHEDWKFTLKIGPKAVKTWGWNEFNALPQTKLHKDIHCVTKWSKFDTNWSGVTIEDILADAEIEPPTGYTLAYSFDGYTTNVPYKDLTGEQAMVATAYRARPRRPGAALGATPLFLEIGEVDQRAPVHQQRRAGLLGAARLPHLRRPLERAAVYRRPISELT